ncbi:tigger transposable element-derived protein 6-like [Ischnura elegans]|uniref:tigger transposable element-derived protein 6-like n=1 Tax=Ischnura elegans TaxID=197161 RepID=UPI001ED86C93|nr:tigger transposable element-derived protein 6-like [Ischnura elegans]
MVQVKIKDYQPCDIYNGDVTGMYFRALLSKTLCVKGENCKGGKHSKERLTIFICGNMAGELLKPLVIGKSARPRCFKNVEIEKLPVKWRHNKKAWNTASIMEEWLKSYNAEMKRKNRKVILFLDNATCHPKIHLANVELAWFPVNTTSIIQPMDQGVIRSLKAQYWKCMMRSLLAAADTANSVSEVIKKILVLDAINWINLAMKDIKQCFAKAGILPELIPEKEPMVDQSELQQVIGIDMNAETFVDFDNDLLTSDEDGSLIANNKEDESCDTD